MAALNILRVNWRWGILLLCSVLFIEACGGSDSPDSNSAEVAPTATAASASGGPASPATSVLQPTATQPSSSGGGGNLGLNDALDELIELYEEMLDVLVDVTDEASAGAAMDDLSRIANEINHLENHMGDYTEAEFTNSALWGRFLGSRQDISNQFNRISVDAAVLELVTEALENPE